MFFVNSVSFGNFMDIFIYFKNSWKKLHFFIRRKNSVELFVKFKDATWSN